MQNLPNPQHEGSDVNFTHYKWNSTLTVHAASQPMLQAANTKTYSAAFNRSKRAGRNLWELLKPVLPDPANKEIQQSIEIALYQWLLPNPLQNTLPVNNVPFITGLQFNEENILKESGNIHITAKRNADNAIELIIPAFNAAKDIIAPQRTESVTFKMMAVSCSMEDGRKAGGFITELTIPYNNVETAAQNILLPITAEQGNLLVVALALEFTILKEEGIQVVHNLRWMPSGIIWAGYN
jgi:hypothetical protein